MTKGDKSEGWTVGSTEPATCPECGNEPSQCKCNGETEEDESLSEETMQGFMNDALEMGMFERFGSPETKALARREREKLQRRKGCE